MNNFTLNNIQYTFVYAFDDDITILKIFCNNKLVAHFSYVYLKDNIFIENNYVGDIAQNTIFAKYLHENYLIQLWESED